MLLWAANASAQFGAEDFQKYCAGCHGPDGKGKDTTWTGEVPEPSGKGTMWIGELPDLTRLSQTHGGKFPFQEVFDVVDGTNRSRWHQPQKGMPYWGFFYGGAPQDAASKAKLKSQITAIVNYIQSIQEK
jgi:hypothetical protein